MPLNNTNCLVIIPARLESTRLPRKLLLSDTGKSVLQHTYEAVTRARRPRRVIVATDHPSIVAEVERFGGHAEMTRADCASGTDRVAEVTARAADAELIVNVQGDEPEIEGEAIDRLVDCLENNPAAVMATLAAPIRNRADLDDPSCVKVVFDAAGRALYFSRSPIPHARDWENHFLEATPAMFHQHIGIYAYRRDFLLRLAQMMPSPLERLEKLEQLRVLEAGETILVETIDHATRGIDTPEDYREFVERRRAG